MPVSDDATDLAEILTRDVPWETYLTARLITDKDLQLIRRYDKRSDELKSSLLDEVGPATCILWRGIIAAFMSSVRTSI